LQLRRKIFFK
jgi:superfamily II DNA/RNA helicase